MNRISFCQACHDEQHGVKTRLAVQHTCGLADNIQVHPRQSVTADDLRKAKEIWDHESIKARKEVRPKKVYISGKIYGEPIHEVTMKFGAAQVRLEALGYEVVNPLSLNDWHVTWRDAMKKCITALLDCEAIYFLPDWEQSKGAMLERTIAIVVGLDFME